MWEVVFIRQKASPLYIFCTHISAHTYDANIATRIFRIISTASTLKLLLQVIWVKRLHNGPTLQNSQRLLMLVCSLSVTSRELRESFLGLFLLASFYIPPLWCHIGTTTSSWSVAAWLTRCLCHSLRPPCCSFFSRTEGFKQRAKFNFYLDSCFLFSLFFWWHGTGLICRLWLHQSPQYNLGPLHLTWWKSVKPFQFSWPLRDSGTRTDE